LQLTWVAAVTAALLATDPTTTITGPLNEYIDSVPSKIGSPTDLMGTTVEGVVVRQRSVQSTEKMDALKKLFIERFHKKGLYLAPEGAQLKGQAGEQVTGLDTENMVTFSVILQPNPKGTTIVVAAADMGHVSRIESNTSNGPVYPGAKNVMTSSLEGTHLMTYSVEATPAEIKSFYRSAYAKAGYTEAGGELVFSRGFERAQVTVDPGLSARTVMVQTGSTKDSPKAVSVPVLEKIKQ
jgi:hypothetical protein